MDEFSYQLAVWLGTTARILTSPVSLVGIVAMLFIPGLGKRVIAAVATAVIYIVFTMESRARARQMGWDVSASYTFFCALSGLLIVAVVIYLISRAVKNSTRDGDHDR